MTDRMQCGHEKRFQADYGDDESLHCLICEVEELRRDKERLIEACRFAHSLLDSHSRSADRIEEKLRQSIDAAKEKQ